MLFYCAIKDQAQWVDHLLAFKVLIQSFSLLCVWLQVALVVLMPIDPFVNRHRAGPRHCILCGIRGLDNKTLVVLMPINPFVNRHRAGPRHCILRGIRGLDNKTKQIFIRRYTIIKEMAWLLNNHQLAPFHHFG